MSGSKIKLIHYQSGKVFSEIEDAIDQNVDFVVTVETTLRIYPSILRMTRSIITGKTHGFIQSSWDTLRTGSLLAAIMLAQERGYKVGARASTVNFEIFFLRYVTRENLDQLEFIPNLEEIHRRANS